MANSSPCLQRSSPARVTSVLYFSPAVTIICAWITFEEPLSWSIILGLFVSPTGVSMVIRSELEYSRPEYS
ncbi:EamA family transporter [Pseudomonas guariconensis]|uniref:EamA family transporter n=1 Tax=Pseudomonas guariconensis TaxID=1288410 RepID=UPI0018A94A2E|nr:EamA family transporter [Pseudomonas guariconensis]MBF8741045.1 EamA family transporter [Pseudomonas guariconensis]MBF8750259.1 EamA family transporter [Pseudomonas guariconensis]